MLTGFTYGKYGFPALLCAVITAACQSAATLPQATLVPPTAIPASPTITPLPPTATPALHTATVEPSATPVGQIETGPFAGRWTGTMAFKDNPDTPFARVVVSIPAGCVVGQACGDIFSNTSGCRFELKLLSIAGDVFNYEFGPALSSGCPSEGGGTLSLQPTGTLIREHVFPDGRLVSGPLTRAPDQS